MQAIKVKKGSELKSLDRKISQQGGSLAAVQGGAGGGKGRKK